MVRTGAADEPSRTRTAWLNRSRTNLGERNIMLRTSFVKESCEQDLKPASEPELPGPGGGQHDGQRPAGRQKGVEHEVGPFVQKGGETTRERCRRKTGNPM